MADGKVQFELDNGQVLLIETEVPQKAISNGFNLTSDNDEEVTIQSQKQFSEVARSIAPVANMVLDSLKELNTPKEIQLEFGVKLDFASNILIAKASTEANFKIMLKWENKDA